MRANNFKKYITTLSLSLIAMAGVLGVSKSEVKAYYDYKDYKEHIQDANLKLVKNIRTEQYSSNTGDIQICMDKVNEKDELHAYVGNAYIFDQAKKYGYTPYEFEGNNVERKEGSCYIYDEAIEGTKYYRKYFSDGPKVEEKSIENINTYTVCNDYLNCVENCQTFDWAAPSLKITYNASKGRLKLTWDKVEDATENLSKVTYVVFEDGNKIVTKKQSQTYTFRVPKAGCHKYQVKVYKDGEVVGSTPVIKADYGESTVSNLNVTKRKVSTALTWNETKGVVGYEIYCKIGRKATKKIAEITKKSGKWNVKSYNERSWEFGKDSFNTKVYKNKKFTFYDYTMKDVNDKKIVKRKYTYTVKPVFKCSTRVYTYNDNTQKSAYETKSWVAGSGKSTEKSVMLYVGGACGFTMGGTNCFTWPKVANAKGYYVYYYKVSDNPNFDCDLDLYTLNNYTFAKIETKKKNEHIFEYSTPNFKKLKKGRYIFRVQAYDKDGNKTMTTFNRSISKRK